MRRVRNSQLRLLRQCPFAYARQYVWNEPGLPNPALMGGRNVHDAAQLLVRRIVEGGLVDVYDIVFRTVRGGLAEYSDALHVVTRMQEAIGVEFDIDPAKVFLLEETLSMPVTLSNGTVVEFYGTPDLGERLNATTCRIPDWKTNFVPDTEAEFAVDWQLKRYALLVHHSYPVFEKFHVQKRFVRYENLSREMVLTVDDLAQVLVALRSEIQAEEEIRAAGVFEATPGEWCAMCEHHAACPAIAALRAANVDELTIDSDERAIELAALAHVSDTAATALKTRLKRYLGAGVPAGSVSLPGGGFYGFAPANHREADYHEIKQLLEAAGVEAPASLAKIDLDTLDRVLARMTDTASAPVRAAIRHWQSSDFRYRKTLPTIKAPSTAVVQEEVALL